MLDPRHVASRLAVERALRWYTSEARARQASPEAVADAEEILGVLEGRRSWRADQFDALVALGRTLHALTNGSPELPTCNVGDGLTALGPAMAAGDGGPVWTFSPKVDPEAFRKLDFEEASAGIASTQRANRESWWAHAQKSRSFIQDAAAHVEKKNLAVVLGAGRAFDLPLLDLARDFGRLVLIDIDEAALGETVDSTFKDPALRARVEPRVMDLTGINGIMSRSIEEALACDGGVEEVLRAIDRVCRSYWLDGGPEILSRGERADLLVSGLVLSQVALPQRPYGEELFTKRFGRFSEEASRRWIDSWWQLELRVQQDHVNALGAAAEVAVITSDVVFWPTKLDAAGVERRTGRQILALGVDSLSERVPKFHRIERHARWQWERNRASARSEGSEREVEGVVLGEPRSAGGLWLPG